ncbi:MAG: CPBP family intramembrane metalloprotease [Bacilli bacterium]|nr:CPBP family intramembrane metalloprotease [Bacilli bacterium]
MKNSLKNLGIFIILFFIFLYKDIFYLIPLKVLNINFDTLSYNMQIFLSICSSLILVIIFIIIYYKYLKEKFIEYKKNISNFLDLGLKYYLVGLFGMFIFNILIMLFSPVKEANNEVLVQEMLKKAPILSFISASILAPFLEEMLFRKSFGDIFKNKKIMVIASGLFFGFLHVIFSIKTPWDLLYIIPYGMLGGGFAYTLYKKDNIFIPITFHFLHNSILIILSILLTVIS